MKAGVLAEYYWKLSTEGIFELNNFPLFPMLPVPDAFSHPHSGGWAHFVG